MDTFGSIVAAILTLGFLYMSIGCILEHFARTQLDDDWKCTQSVVISQKNAKPVVEKCVQYTLQTTK